MEADFVWGLEELLNRDSSSFGLQARYRKSVLTTFAITADRISAGAKEKIEKAGGSVTLK